MIIKKHSFKFLTWPQCEILSLPIQKTSTNLKKDVDKGSNDLVCMGRYCR